MILSMAFSYALCKACMHEFHTEFTLHYLALFAFGMFACELTLFAAFGCSRVPGALLLGIIRLGGGSSGRSGDYG